MNYFISTVGIISPYIFIGMILYILSIKIIYRGRKPPKLMRKVFNYL